MLDYGEALRDACELIDRLYGDCPLNSLNSRNDIDLVDWFGCEKCKDNFRGLLAKIFQKGAVA